MQQQKSSCVNCGAELLPEGRFCRRCGQPSNPLERGSVTEVTTRRLGTPAQPFAPGQNFTGPQGLEQHGTRAAGPASETRALAPSQSSRKSLPPLVILLIAVLLPTFLVVRHLQNKSRAIVRPPAVVAPPQPPRPLTATEVIDQRFIYPGAVATTIIANTGEGNTVLLETDDPINKVTDWYVEQFKPTERVIQPERVILKAEDVNVIISARSFGSRIMLNQRKE